MKSFIIPIKGKLREVRSLRRPQKERNPVFNFQMPFWDISSCLTWLQGGMFGGYTNLSLKTSWKHMDRWRRGWKWGLGRAQSMSSAAVNACPQSQLNQWGVRRWGENLLLSLVVFLNLQMGTRRWGALFFIFSSKFQRELLTCYFNACHAFCNSDHWRQAEPLPLKKVQSWWLGDSPPYNLGRLTAWQVRIQQHPSGVRRD